jgi:2,5-diketo-D-gluconate reductase A
VTRSANPQRIRENFAALAFRLEAEDIARIDALDNPAGGRVGPDPDRMGS